MTGGWTLGLKCCLTELDLRHLLEEILQTSLITEVVSIAPVAPGEPFSTDPVEHLLENGYVHLKMSDGAEVTLSQGMVLAGFREWACRRIETGQAIPTCLGELTRDDCQAVLEAAVRAPRDLSDFYQIDLPNNEGVPLIFLDRQVAHDRFMELFARHGNRMVSDDWVLCNHMLFEAKGEALCSLKAGASVMTTRRGSETQLICQSKGFSWTHPPDNGNLELDEVEYGS